MSAMFNQYLICSLFTERSIIIYGNEVHMLNYTENVINCALWSVEWIYTLKIDCLKRNAL